MSKLSKILGALSILNVILLFVLVILLYNAPDKSTFSIYAFIFSFILAIIDGGVFTISYYLDRKEK